MKKLSQNVKINLAKALAKAKLKYFIKGEAREMLFQKEISPRAVAIICAGGSSSRMEGIDKISLEIAGLPVWARSCLAFEECELVSKIIVVAREAMLPKIYEDIRLNRYGIRKLTMAVAGGKTRQESVFRGVREAISLGEEWDVVSIHDGARPFVREETIRSSIIDAYTYGGSSVCIKSRDTIKEAGEDGFIKRTIDREFVYSAQTPQSFSFKKYIKAMENAESKGLDFTDDCQLFEAMGERVFITKGDSSNLKITRPEDLRLIFGMESGLE